MKMYKSKRQKNKSFDWYGLSQRFSIRKYHFGAASVLLGTALILGAAQTTVKAEEAVAENKTEAVTSTSKDDEGTVAPANVTLPATEARTGTPVLDKKELSEEDIAKLVAEASKKDEKATETAKTDKSEDADKEKASLTAASTEDKSKKAVDDKADKKDEKKAENPIAATKTILEQLTSEAEVLNTTAANYAEKKVEDKSSKEAIAAAVAAAKVEITASKKVLIDKDVTVEQLNLQLQRISSAIEAVYTEMKRAGHIGKVEAVLAGETSTVVNIVAPLTKTAVKNLTTLTEEEIRAIEKEVRSSNPGLTDEDTVTVSKEGIGGTAGAVTVTLAAGRLTQNGTNTITFGSTDVVVGTAGTKNVEQLKNAINWFDFANASITYPDGTKVSAVKYLNAPESGTVQSPNRGNITGKFTMYREVLDSPDKTLIGKRTIDQEVIDKGFAKYAFNRTYNKVNRENNALYEVLQEGMKFNVKTKVEGYELTATVAKLAPKQVKNSVIPQDKNYSRNLNEDGSYDPAYVILKPQDENYSTLGKSGIQTTYRDESGVERKMLTAFASADDGGNVGVTFDLAATFNGRPVAVNAIAADSEDLNGHEFTQFETNGTPWKEFMTVQPKNAKGGIVLNTNPLGYNVGKNDPTGSFGLGIKRANNEKFLLGYNNDEWKNNTANNEEPGFGSTLFGPFISPQDGGTLPIGITQNVSRLSVYVNAAGNQTATIGFVVYDGGDAPESYGSAQHIIGTFNKEKDGKQVTATQPYLGDQPADPDFRNTTTEPSGAWVLDDLVHTEKYEEIPLKHGDKISNALGETGTYDIVDGVSVIRVSSTKTIAIKQGEIVSINRPKKAENSTELVEVPVRGVFNNASQSVGIGALPDEGEKQLIDPSTGIKEYTLRQATDNEYVLEGIRVNRGVNNDDAYVRAWVDFNNNGKFDQFEASDVAHITQDGTINLSFKNTPQLLDTSVDSIGVRIRIALKEKEILVPTGIASSGEVEDFLTHVVHFPRGTRHRSEGYQGQKQEVNVPTTAMFRANGKSKDSDYKKWAEMEQTIAPKFVLTESTVASAEETGNEVNITLKGTTVYGGKEVVLKNAKGQTLATAIKVTNPNNGKVEYLTSEYTEYDTKGNKVGVYTLNPEGENGKNTDGPGNLKYTKVTFKPELGYVGTANGVAIRAWDENRNSTGWEATATTIKQATEDNTLADKDKISENVNKKTNGRLSMDTVYIPKVIDIKPVGKDETTIDEQGKQQSATPKIPDHGTVESINNEHIDEAKVDKSHVLINRHEPVKFSLVKDVPGKTYTEDTKVTKATVITYEDGGTEEFKPVDKIPGTTNIAETQDLTVTGTGNVTVSNVRIAKGTLSTNEVPAGAILEGSRPKAAAPVTVLRNGVEVRVNTGGYIEKGDQLVTPLQVLGGDQTTTWKITFQKGDVIPKASANITPRLVSETSVDQLINTKGESLILGGKEYVNNNDVIPKGTKTAGTTVDLTTVTLPKATHVNPKTGEVTTVERRYTKVTENEIEIENEGTYTLVPRTSTDAQGKTVYEDAEIIFKPHPSFVGVGTGVTIKQPDTDYDGPVETDKVTKRYGIDYGSAKYTPTVTPSLTATITRKIHYVYEGDAATAPKDKTPILSIDNKPVVNEQTLTYDRDYIIMENDGETKKDIKVSTVTTLGKPITIKRLVKENNQTVEKEITTNVLQPGDEVKAGTQLSAGTVIIGAWKPINDENAKFSSIISPVLKGYTAEVQLPASEYTKKDENGVQTHVRSANNTPAGIYTPLAQGGTVDTVNVGTYEPLVSVVRADDQDDFDVYVYYKADKQKANVVYIDLDEKGDKRVLETQSGTKVTELPTGATQDPKTTYGVEKLSGNSDSTIPYATAETIKKYVDKGYELASDDYTNDENGRALADGRKFDEDSSVDQTFYVYLRHKKEQLSKNDVRTVTRHIEYKYADTTDVPADKRNQPVETTLAKKVTEVLTFERTRTIDMAATAKLYETQYNAYKAVVANNAVGSDAEVEARATLFKYVEDKAKEAGATDEAKAVISYGEWQAKPGQATNLTLSAAEENIKDSKFNDVVSPTVPGYLPDNAKVEATADVNPESDPKEYTVTVTYTPVEQKAIVNFVEVDATNTDQVITPGLTTPVTLTGKSGTAFPTTASTSVQAKIDELVKKGYELVANGNGFVATDSFDTNSAVDQTYTVKLRVKPITVTPNDPTPTPNTPIDPNNPEGPKWTPELIKELEDGRKEEVKRTINYVYADGTKAKDSVEETKEFKRSATINPVTGKITFGEWSAAQRFEEKQSPAIDNYTPDKASVEAKEVTATADDITETVVYRQTKPITVQPNDPTPTKDQPIDPNNPNNPDGPKWTEELLKKLEDARKEEVNRTITYKYSDVASELKADDAAKAGQNAANEVTNKVEFKRPVTIDPKTLEFTYGDWVATNNDTILEGNATVPVVPGYVATGDVEKSKTDVTDVKATDKDITDKVVYKALGKFVPVVPEGFTPPTIENPQYPNNNEDPSKPGDPTTTTTIPYVPGTTPVGPDGQPLKPKVEGDPKQGYVPPAPTTPTGDTTITYVKDGTQIAVTKFVDTTGKGLAPSVVDTGDTGKAFTKDADVTAAINKILARGYEKVANVNANEKDYPSTDAEKVFDADAKTNQEFTVTFKPKELPTDPTKPVDPNNNPVDPTDPASPNKPRDPETTVTPKPTDPVPNDPKGRTYGDLGLVEQVTRTIRYVYEDGSPVEAEKLESVKAQQSTTLTFTRKAKINAVTGEVTYLQADGITEVTADNPGWTATNGSEFVTVKSPTIENYTAVVTGVTPTTDTVPAKTVTATDKDFEEVVVYKKVKPVTITPTDNVPNDDPNTPVDPNNPIQPGKPIDPNNPDGPKWTKDLIDKLRDARQETVTRTITYKYSTEATDLKADDAAKAGTDVKENVTVTNTVTFKRAVTIDPITKEFTYGDWVADNNDTTLEGKADLPAVPGYVATGDVDASKKDVTDVKATDKDITDKVVYKVLGKFVPVVPEGFTPPTIQNPQYPNNNEDPSKPGTPTTTIPHVPGLTPLNPTTGQPLEPVTPGNPKDGYKVPELPKDPTQNTTITYVKDGSQVAVVHFVDDKGNSVNESVIETGDTGGTISTTKADAVKTALEAKGYEVVAPTDATLYTADKEAFYKEADRKFDAVSDKATGAADEKVPSQQYYVIVKAKELPVVPTKPVNPNNDPVDPTDPTTPNKPRDPETTVTPKPTDPVPNDPKGRTYGELGLVEQVTRTIDYVYDNGTKVEEDKLGTAKDERTKTLTFTRNAKINAVTGEVTYLDANGNATTKEAAPWTPATTNTFNTVNSPVIDTYVLLDSNQKTITGETVAATDKDIAHKVVYKKAGSIKPQIPAGVNPLTPATDTPYPNNPQDPSGVLKPDPTKPTDPTQPNGPTTPVIPEVPGYTPYGPNGKPLEKDPNGGYKVPDLPTDPTQDTPIVYVKNGEQLAITKFVDVDGNGLAPSVVDSGDEGTNFTKDGDVTATINAILARGYEKVENKNNEKPYPTEATDKVFDKDSATNQEFTVTFKPKELPVVPTKPVDPNNNPVDPTTPNKPRDPETSVTPKPEDKVPNDPKGRTYGELGLVEEVTRTINYVKNDGSKAADPVKETLTFTRKAKINAVTGEVTYLAADGVTASTKEDAPWTAVNGDKFAEKTSPEVANYTPTVEKVAEKTGVTATDPDIIETVVYNPSTTNVDPNPVTPGENPDPNKVVENDPKKRTLKELGLIEEVTHTVHYKLEDGSDAGIADNVQKVTFTRTAKIDSVTGAILEYGNWTPETKEFTAVTTPAKDGYIASAKTSTANANVGATDKDTEETIIYRKLGSYVPVVPAGVTPPADFDKTPKPYPNATPEDPTRPGTPTTPTTTIPEIPGTTPVGPDGTPLTKNPNGGYDLPPVPTDPTQNTTITYVKDGSQVAVVHFVDEKGRAVNESVVETGDTGNTISKTNVDAVKAKLEAKGYVVVEPTDALYTTDKEGFYKEETRTFDAVSDKSTGTAGEKVPSQQYYVIVKAKEIPADPTKPGTTPGTDTPTGPKTPENGTPTPGTNTPAKPGDKIPGDPLNRTYGDLGLVEEVTRTINYVKNDGSKAADPVKETLTFTRKAKINAVTGEVTYLAADGVTPVASKDDAPWTAVNGTEFKAVKSPTGAEKPELANYTPTKAEVEAKTGVTATDEDIVETVVYNPTTETVDPKDPNFDPEKPLDPNNPNGPKYKDLKLTEEVARTITYTYADDVADTTKRGTVAAPEFKTTVSFTRTATINKATGEVTYSDWAAKDNDTTLEKDTKDLPLIPGYVATGALEAIKKDVENVNATDKDITDKIVYKDLGKYVPVVPEGTTPPTIENPKYPNHPTDPTKPGEPTTTIPNVPGLTPLDPSTGKPLEPKDPNDLTKGYKPPVPQVPSENTNIVYVADGSQVTVVHFVDEDGNAVHTSFVEAGDAGAKFTKAGEVTKVVDELKKQGYVVVPNKAGQAEYPGEAGVFDSVDDKGKDGVSQVYYVTVAKTIPVTPTTPQNPNEDPKNPNPGDPIDPKNPTGPKWTKDALDKLNNIKSVTRTITYIKDGTEEEVSTTEAPKVTNKVSFTRTVVVNPKDGSVVGYDTNGDGVADVPATDTTSGWTAAGTAKFAEVKSPVVKGYVVKPNQDTQGDLVEADGSKVKASTTDLTVDSPNQDLKVRYVVVGKIVPKIPEGETPSTPVSETPYGNDPKDPGKVVTPDPTKPTDPQDPNSPKVPVVPHVPGYTPKDPNGNPLKPVDPEDPTKGYVPPTPTTPTENTEINYEKDTQKAVTKFVDPSGKPIPGVTNIEETGKSGEPLTKATEVTTEITKLIAKGYDLVSNNYGQDNNGNFDKDSGKDQEYKVVLTPHVEPIKPFDPTNPNDPNKPEPGKPIDPNNPDGPKWTKELIDNLNTTKHVTRTITYVEDATDKEVADKATDKVTFTREAKINLVTGTIEYGKWTPVNNDTTFDKVTSPVVKGYVLKDASQKDVEATENLTENSKDENIKVVYVPVGRIVPKVPEGVTPPTPTPYDNDPKDPGKVVPPSPTKPTDPQDPNSPKVPVIPHIPGTTPQVPTDPTKPVGPNNPLVPLKPVDPKDPSKGYEVPPVPTNPGTDTPIYYVNDKQKAITNFVDNNGKVVSDSVVDQGDSGSKFTKSGEVESKIKELVKKGYVVTSNDYPSVDKDRVFDKDKDKDQIFNVKVTPLIVPTDPNSPDKPMVPTDPTKPVGPNNPLRPVTPSRPEPGKPVFPEDPNSPVWPETVKDLVTESSATRTITYVDRNGKEVAATHTETIKFKRSAKVNLVTGEITYGDWTVVGDDTILDGNKLPKVDGYIARGGDIESSQKDVKATAGVNITETVVYDKLGSWIPKLPEGQNQVPPTPYPNDPTDPTKPGTDKPKVPYVPGFIPVDPEGQPLKPVDPNDPTKGYEVPNVPGDPTKDTPINYVPNDPKPNPTPYPGPNPAPSPQPAPAPKPEPNPETPKPVTPADNGDNNGNNNGVPTTPAQPEAPSTPQYMDGQRELPNTGTEANASLAALGLLGVLSGFGLIARKKREDEE